MIDRDPQKAQAWRERSARRYQQKRRNAPAPRLGNRGAKSKREQPALAAFRLALHLRSGGFCEARTPACPPGRHEGTDAHHCAPSDRDAGRHDPERGLLLCRPGHNYVHATPAESYAAGWLIKSGHWSQEAS